MSWAPSSVVCVKSHLIWIMFWELIPSLIWELIQTAELQSGSENDLKCLHLHQICCSDIWFPVLSANSIFYNKIEALIDAWRTCTVDDLIKVFSWWGSRSCLDWKARRQLPFQNITSETGLPKYESTISVPVTVMIRDFPIRSQRPYRGDQDIF